MNERIKQLALNAGLLNYVDNETPRRYFINGHADIEEVKEFAELIVWECAKQVEDFYKEDRFNCLSADEKIKEYFGIEE